MHPYLCVALGGALGAVSRYACGNLPFAAGSPHFRTMAINIAGCFLIGVAWAVIESLSLPRVWHNTLVAGFLGGFTTYSTFSLETVRLLTGGHITEALLYALLTVTGCIAACAAALYLTAHLVKS